MILCLTHWLKEQLCCQLQIKTTKYLVEFQTVNFNMDEETLLSNFKFWLIFIYYKPVAEEAMTQLFIEKEHSNTVFQLSLRKEIILENFKEKARFRLFIKISSVHIWTFLFPLTQPYFTMTNLGTVLLVLIRYGEWLWVQNLKWWS